jgi:hypothetical protein
VLTVRQLEAAYAVLAASPAARDVAPPPYVRAVAPGATSTEVVEARSAVVLDAPYLLPLLDGVRLVPAPVGSAERLADLLDLPLASDEEVGPPDPGAAVRVPPEARLLLDAAPETWWQHDELVVDGVDLPWLVVDGQVHASTLAGLAYALCWVAGAWPLRDTVAAVLAGELPVAEALLLGTL